MSYIQTYYHIIFSTKLRKNTLSDECVKELYAYIWGIIKNKKCHLYQIGGTKNHIHILTSLNTSISLADFIREIKANSSHWLKKNNHFSTFCGWQSEYAAFTKCKSNVATVIEYIKNQKEHHANETFEDEFRRLLKENNIEFDEKYLFK